MLFGNQDLDFSFFEIPGSDFKFDLDRNKFVSSSEGFERGNMMRDEYVPYKNYCPVPLTAKTDREQKLYQAMQYCFAIVDLNLYLDTHPDDVDAYRLFQKYVEEEKKAKKEYTEKYGPIVVTNANYKNYEWTKNPWPWDNLGGGMYV